MHWARAMVRTRKISAKAFVVYEALLWVFHNSKTGRCFPSYERIAAIAGCARSTVALAIKSLEEVRLLTWHNRIVRLRIAGVVQLVRTSNAYQFPSLVQMPTPKSDVRPGTPVKSPSIEGSGPLEAALARLGRLVKASSCSLSERCLNGGNSSAP